MQKSKLKRKGNPNPAIAETCYWKNRSKAKVATAEALQRKKEQEMLKTTSLKDIIH